MNKDKLWISMLIIGGILLSGAIIATASFWQYSLDTQEQTQEEALQQVALTADQAAALAAGTMPGMIEEVELARVNNDLVYLIEIIKDEEEYAVQVDAMTGMILKIEKETEVGKKELEVVQARITEEQAKQNALNSVGGGSVQEVDVEKVNGRYLYEIEVKQQEREFEVAIDLLTGEIVSVEEELQEEPEELVQDSRSSTELSREEMEAIAIAKVGGTATDFERKGETLYEVEVQTSAGEADVVINSRTGEVVRIERD